MPSSSVVSGTAVMLVVRVGQLRARGVCPASGT